ncbi:hypothetical protein [Bradyrhizobium sp. CCBAU 45389]|uniref:hypothetical protein n=1 Tax=Bradyrhizobium sp. CCBAU 45389 TaxID=858429 RepID=UPI0023067FA4|nr:hypothetical protein [Bradyrhizobium sp. CCBAU 45389]
MTAQKWSGLADAWPICPAASEKANIRFWPASAGILPHQISQQFMLHRNNPAAFLLQEYALARRTGRRQFKYYFDISTD